MKILKDRLYKTLDYQQPPEQAGFRKEFATIDHIHTFNQLTERANEYNLDLRILLIDFAKAFDSMYHHKVWEALASQGVPSTATEILVYLYQHSKGYIKLDQKGGYLAGSRIAIKAL